MLERQKNKTLTPVDLRLGNGDTISKTSVQGRSITAHFSEPPPGLLDPAYIPIPSTDTDSEPNDA